MIVGFDARFYGSAGGLARYSQQLLNQLAKIDTTNQYVVFLGKASVNEFKTNNTNFKKVLVNARWYTLKEQLIMPIKIWRQKIDLMHFFHWNVPLLYRHHFVVTIHDLILLKYPSKKATTLSPFFFWLKYWAYKKVLRHAIYDSVKIIVPSEFVKKDILANFKVPAEKIAVIYEGVTDHRLRTTDDGPLNKNLTSKPFNHLTIKPYLLYIGVAYPHKNLEGLIEAFKIFCDRYSREYHLVLAGQENYFCKQLNNLLIFQSSNLPIIFTGFIPDSQLPALYQNASLYVFPSFSEGFGLPGLEAMLYGLPVVAANNSCLPEIYGEAAYYFDPHNPEEIAAAINKVLTDKNLQESLRQKGFEQIKKYSWEKMAQETMKIYCSGEA